MSIMRFPAILALVSAAAIAPAIADTQTVPCVGCFINATENAAQVREHRALVQQSVQQSLNNQLNVQNTNQTLQSIQLRNQLLNDMNANGNSLQTILLEQQLLLLRLESQPLRHEDKRFACLRAHRTIGERQR